MMYKYYIESGGISYEHTPLNAGQLTKTWSLAENEAYKGYDEKISEGVVFGKAVYDFMKILESTSFCDVLYFRIESSCDGINFSEYIRTQFYITNVEFKPSHCIAVVKTSKIERCNNRQKVYNVFALGQKKSSIKIRNGTIDIEYISYTGTTIVNNPSQGYWNDPSTPFPSDKFFVIQKNELSWYGVSGTITTTWAREVLTTGCTDFVDGSWALLQDNCPTNKKYVREAFIGNWRIHEESETTTTEGDVFIGGVEDNTIQEIPNGVTLKSVLEYLVSMSCDLTGIKSDFFQINPDNPSTVNYVTGLKTETDHIFLWDNSDVKRPLASQQATVLNLSFDTLLLVLKQIFNVRWTIDGNTLVIEHLSYFTKMVSIDATTQRYLPYIISKDSYRYDTGTITKYETLSYKASRRLSSFRKSTIDYSACSSAKDETKSVIINCTTDLLLCLNNPSIDSSVVSDDGFFVGACGYNSNNELYFLTRYEANVGEITPNNTLSPIFLLKNYHRWGRPFFSGLIDGTMTNFFDVKIKEGDEIEIPICCGDRPVNPNSLIKTLVGDGEIEEIKQSLLTGKTSFKLKY
jgi:hypothetical protein